MGGFKKPHDFAKAETLKVAPSASAFVSGAPVEMPPNGMILREEPRPPAPAPMVPKPKKVQVREGFKKEGVIFPIALSNTIRGLAEKEFSDFSTMTRALILEALKARGVKVK